MRNRKTKIKEALQGEILAKGFYYFLKLTSDKNNREQHGTIDEKFKKFLNSLKDKSDEK